MTFRDDALESLFQTKPTEKIQTTVGELVEALTQVAIEAGNSEAEGYHLASLALADLLKRRRRIRRSKRARTALN